MEETLLKAYDRLVERLNIDRDLKDAGQDGIFSTYMRGQQILNLQAFEARYPEMINSTSPTQEDAMESFILSEGRQPMAAKMLMPQCCDTVGELEVFLSITDELAYTVQPTYFGCRLELVYSQGTLFRVMQYNTPITGTDCYDAAIKAKGIPTKIPVQADLSVFHGHITISKENLAEYDRKLPPRVAVEKILETGEGAEYLDFILQEVVSTGCRLYDTDDAHYTRLNRAHSMHIGVVKPSLPVDYTQVAGTIEKMSKQADDNRYYFGGIDVKVNDILARDLIGGSKWSLFWQIPMKAVSSVVTDVVFKTGLGGLIFPTIKIEPRTLFGVEVKGINSHMMELRKLGVMIGDTIEISQSGKNAYMRTIDVSARPKDASPPVLPTTCSCGTPLTIAGPRHNVLRCDNYHECDSQIVARLKRYLSIEGIQAHLNELVLRKLVSTGKVRSVPDLYLLKELDLTDLHVSRKSAVNFLKSLEWARERIVASRHLTMLFIPTIHPMIAADLCNHAYLDSIVVLAINPAYDEFLIDLIGPAPAAALKKFCEDERGATLLTRMGQLLRD